MSGASSAAEAVLKKFQFECCSCKGGCNEDDSTAVREDCRRCKRCNALRSRINRLLANNENLKASWDKCGEEQKKNFISNPDNQQLFAGDLKMQLEVTASESHKTSSSTKFKGVDKYKDEIDIIAKYEHKPGQAASIIKNADSFVCPNRGVRLYADIEYEGAREEGEEHVQEKKRQLSQDQTIKPPKKPKTTPKTEVSADGATETTSGAPAAARPTAKKSAKPWSDTNTKKTDKIKKDLQEIVTEVEVLLEENDAAGKTVQGAVLLAAQKCVADTNATIAEIQLTIGSQNAEGLSDRLATWTQTLKKAKSTKKLLKDQLDYMSSLAEE
jgi:hypothetical protein